MKTTLKRILSILIFILLLIGCGTSVSAHSGRTDRGGGHKDNNNISGLGDYHYHCGGYPAHLHSDGYCPYAVTTVLAIEEISTNQSLENTTSYDMPDTNKSNEKDKSAIVGLILLGIAVVVIVYVKKPKP